MRCVGFLFLTMGQGEPEVLNVGHKASGIARRELNQATA